MALEIGEDAQKIIKDKHLWNAAWYLAKISNSLHIALADNDKTIDVKQLQADQIALKNFQQEAYGRKININ